MTPDDAAMTAVDQSGPDLRARPPVPRILPPAPNSPAGRHPVWTGFAAFLLGLTMGISVIVVGQALVVGETVSDPPPLRH